MKCLIVSVQHRVKNFLSKTSCVPRVHSWLCSLMIVFLFLYSLCTHKKTFCKHNLKKSRPNLPANPIIPIIPVSVLIPGYTYEISFKLIQPFLR